VRFPAKSAPICSTRSQASKLPAMALDARHFSRVLTRAFLVPILALAALAAVLAWETTALVSAMRWVDHTDQVTTRARYLLRLILDEETGARGYLLAGDESFLQPYRDARPQVSGAFQTLASLTYDSPDQQRRVERMRSETLQWHEVIDRMIALRRSGHAAIDTGLLLDARRRMDTIRALRDEFLEREEGLRDERVQSLVRRTIAVLITALGISIVVGILLGVWTRRQMIALSRVYGATVETAERRAEKIRESEFWLSTILNSIADAVIATDAEGHVRFMNDVARALTGWREGNFIGEPLTRVFPAVNERSGESVGDVGKGLLQPDAAPRKPETALLRTQDQTTIAVDTLVAPIRGRDGRTEGIVLVARDLTERRQSEAALRSSDKLANIGRLAATVAHEIHNPLDAIGNLLYLLEHSATVSDTDREHVRMAREELDRVAQITQQMLKFNRESRAPMPVTLNDILENVLTLYHGKITQRRAAVDRRYERALPVIAFPGELRQVFSNLVGNALEALPAHGRLIVSLCDSRDWRDLRRPGVRVTIADTGAGIPAEFRARITQPFFTTKGEKGTGLGLWVSRGIVEKYGGSMRFRSSTASGRSGTIFSIFLPVAAERNQEEQVG
jgi:PAS domain S-box-containing protein